MEVLKGVAFTFKVINEDTTAITKTWANARLQVPDSVLTMLKYLEKKLSGYSCCNMNIVTKDDIYFRPQDKDDDPHLPLFSGHKLT